MHVGEALHRHFPIDNLSGNPLDAVPLPRGPAVAIKVSAAVTATTWVITMKPPTHNTGGATYEKREAQTPTAHAPRGIATISQHQPRPIVPTSACSISDAAHDPMFGHGKVAGIADHKLTIAFEEPVTKAIRDERPRRRQQRAIGGSELVQH
jgi:hypothetical protein